MLWRSLPFCAALCRQNYDACRPEVFAPKAVVKATGLSKVREYLWYLRKCLLIADGWTVEVGL